MFFSSEAITLYYHNSSLVQVGLFLEPPSLSIMAASAFLLLTRAREGKKRKLPVHCGNGLDPNQQGIPDQYFVPCKVFSRFLQGGRIESASILHHCYRASFSTLQP